MSKIFKSILTLAIILSMIISPVSADVFGGSGGRVDVPNPPGDTTAEAAEAGNDNIVVGVGKDDDGDFFVWQKPQNFNFNFFMDTKSTTITKQVNQVFAAAGFTSDWDMSVLRTTTTFNGFIIGESSGSGRARYAAFNMQPRNIASTTSPTDDGTSPTDLTGFRASAAKANGKFYGYAYSPGSGGALYFARFSNIGTLETSGPVGGVNLVENLDVVDFSDFTSTPDISAILDRGAAGVFLAVVRDNNAVANTQIAAVDPEYVAISPYAGMNDDNAAVVWVDNGDINFAIVSPVAGTITTGPFTSVTPGTTDRAAVIYNPNNYNIAAGPDDIIITYSDGTTTRVLQYNTATSASNDYALSPNVPMAAAPRDNNLIQASTFDGGMKGTNTESGQPTGSGGGGRALGGVGNFMGVFGNQPVELAVVLGGEPDPDPGPGNNQILFPLPWFPVPFDAGGGGGGATPFPYDTTEIYTSGCMVFRAGGQTQLSTLFGVTDTPTIGVNDAPFSGIALGANYTLGDVTEVQFHENLSATATFDFDQANVTPGTQTKRGAFRLVSYGSMVPITFSLQANTTEGTHGLNFSNSSGDIKHYGYFDTVFNGTINITADPAAPIVLLVYSADGILLHNSTADATPAVVANASYMLLNFTSFGDGEGQYAQITPVVGGRYDFTDATYTNTAGTRFTVELSTANGSNPVCGIRLISTQPAGTFIHTLAKRESDTGIATTYPVEQFLNIAQDETDNAHGVFYEKDVDATAAFLTPEGLFTTGFDMSMGPVSATPEFSPTTLLLAVLVAGGMIMFVVRRRKQ